MISSVVGAVLKDMVLHREHKGLPEGYPEGLCVYKQKTEEELLWNEWTELAQLLAAGSSVIEAASGLRSRNGLFASIVEMLMHDLSGVSKTSELSRQLQKIDEAGAQYQQIYVKEKQSLLLRATGVDSPIIQIAAPIDPAELSLSTLPGIPSVGIYRSLIGGARIFYNGTVRDDSWRSRLTKLLTAVKHV